MYERIAAWFYDQVWAMRAEKVAVLEALLLARMAGKRIEAADVAAVVNGRRESVARPAGGVAVLPIHGVIAQRADLITEASGGTSTEAITRALRYAVADPEVGGIVLDVDSPGGSVFGIEELAGEIRAAGHRKPVVAVANSQAASAAYWLASQAGDLSVTPSGEVGSIGVLAAHEDVSAMQEKLGVRTSLITAGKFKGEATPYAALTDDARAALQSRVDAYYASFTRAVAKGRGVPVDAVRAGMGEGRMVGAAEAVALGMADRVETLDAAIARLAARLAGAGTRPTAAAEAWLPPIAAADEDAGTPALHGVAAPGAATRDAIDRWLTADLEPLLEAELDCAAIVASPVAPHGTATSDAAWDGPANEKRLPSPVPLGTARRAYAYVETDRAEAGAVPKDACRFVHHFVNAEGSPGAASTVACSTGIGVLNGGRGGTVLEGADREGVYRHLAAHLKDAGMEPPPLRGEDAAPDPAAVAKDAGRHTPALRRRRLALRARAAAR